jgi:DNA-binding transcriptional ArsR family regulator
MSRRPASADAFAAIADPTRRRLLDSLAAGEQTVLTLAAPFRMTLSAISQHLKLLRDAGLVHVRKSGRERYYRLDPRPLRRVADWIEHYDRFWRKKLDALGDHLERNPT